jgi:hypothetical protein
MFGYPTHRERTSMLRFLHMNFRYTLGIVALVTCACVAIHAADAKPKNLPPGVLVALARDQKDYCAQFLGDYKKGCRQTFQANLLWLELDVTPSGEAAILVENHNMGACGSAGCTLYLFVRRPEAKFVQVLGTHGDVGELGAVSVLKEITKGHYNIQKTWRDGKTQSLYFWDGSRYSEYHASTPD